MVDFAKIIRNAVATMDGITDSLQCVVMHSAWTGSNDAHGQPIYSAPVARDALVSKRNRLISTPQGQTSVILSHVTFLRPVIVTRSDKIILPDGTTGPVLEIIGEFDPGTNLPYMAEVILGSGGGVGGIR